MRPNSVTYTPAALDANGFADNVAYDAGGYALTATTAADSLAHIVTILGNAATNHAAKTFTITGTDANDAALTEAIAGPNGVATVSTTGYFKTVTSVTVDSTTGADTFDIGWTGVSVGPVYPIDWRSDAACNIFVDISGTIDFTIQQTFVNVLNRETPSWSSISALAAKTADTYGQASIGATAIRLLVNSLTATATATINTSQPLRSSL